MSFSLLHLPHLFILFFIWMLLLVSNPFFPWLWMAGEASKCVSGMAAYYSSAKRRHGNAVCSWILVLLIDFPVLRPDCVVSELQVLHASPATELEFAVKTWHRFGCMSVMGHCLSHRPLQSSDVCFVLDCFRQGTFFAIRVYICCHYQCIYLWLDTMHGRRETKRGNESCIGGCSACSGSLL